MRVVSLILLAGFSVVFAEDERVFKDDPVALAGGKTLAGQQQLSATHAGTTYLFASSANLEIFEKDPARYAIAMGGACARMGPLSGRGRLDLYAVHDQRIYVFGSEGCRTTFLKDPARAFDPDQNTPGGGDAEAGKKWIETLVNAMGGKALDGVKQFSRSFEETVKRGEQDWRHVRSDEVTFPATYSYRDDWNDRKFGRAISGDQGHFTGFEGDWAMEPIQVRAMTREFLTLPPVLLRMRHQPGFLARSMGEEKIGDRVVAAVSVSFRGIVQTLLIDKESGLLAAQRFRGRGADRLFAPIEKRYSQYQSVGGLNLPVIEETLAGDEVLKTETWVWTIQ